LKKLIGCAMRRTVCAVTDWGMDWTSPITSNLTVPASRPGIKKLP
jgi:hypothetical protein